jgi:pyruvate dehydrogenase E2 component (dihydrolipoamide acetyltransferase)
MSRIKEFPLPDLGEGLTEGEILKWLVRVGDTVTLNQPIVEVETAKAAVEIPAKWAGQVTAIFHDEGETVDVGTAIIAIDTDPGAEPRGGNGHGGSAVAAPSPEALAAVEAAGDAPIEPGLIGGPAPGGRTAVLVGYGPRTVAAKRRPRIGATAPPHTGPTAPAPAAPPPAAPPAAPPLPAPPAAPPMPAATSRSAAFAAAPTNPASSNGGRVPAVLAKPPVRKLAKDIGVDLRTLIGSGPQGSITRDDVLTARSGPTPAGSAPAVTAPDTAPGFDAGREQRIPIKGVRKLTAANMVASAFTAPHVTEFVTVDVTRSIRALERLRGQAQWRDVRVSPLLLVAKAVLLAVPRHPMINSTWSAETNEIVVKEYVNLGIAAATPRGLIVPNIKDAARLSTRALAEAMTGLVTSAKEGRTTPSEMVGGTFTITNVGIYGVDTGTPILPPGEAAILAVGVIKKAPWVHKGRIKVRDVTTLALSFDHRIIDGELGSMFLRDVAGFLTDPEAALLAWA